MVSSAHVPALESSREPSPGLGPQTTSVFFELIGPFVVLALAPYLSGKRLVGSDFQQAMSLGFGTSHRRSSWFLAFTCVFRNQPSSLPLYDCYRCSSCPSRLKVPRAASPIFSIYDFTILADFCWHVFHNRFPSLWFIQ